MKRLTIVIVFLLALMVAEPVSAQISSADSAAVLLGVANRLRAEGRAALANSLLDLIVQQFPTTPAAVEAQRMRLEFRGVAEERSGKTELLVFSTMYGLALGGLVPLAFEANDPEIYGLGLIVGGPSGFLLGRQLLRSRPLSEGQVGAITFGTLWGAWQAVGWTEVLESRQLQCDIDVCFDNGPSGTSLLRAGLMGSAAGLGVGALLAKKEIPAGTAATVSFGALWGTWYAVGFGVLANQQDHDDRLLTIALIGGDLGLVSTALMAPKWNFSQSRARLISIAGVAGGLAGAGALLILQPDGEESIIIPMVTSAVGLALGVGWTRNYDERSGPGTQPGEALLDRGAGSWRVGMPQIAVRALEINDGGKRRVEPGLYVPLLKARF